MSDVMNAPPQPAMKAEFEPGAQGQPIWYELMTPDPIGVAPFYHATLGWEIPADGMSNPNGSEYRMIGRADGGSAGGVLTLSPMMIQGGARQGWLPYFYVDDVDAAAGKAWELGGHVHMAPSTIDGVGRIAMLTDPQGAAFYVMKPTPPAGDPNAKSDVFEPRTPGHCWWNELETPDEPASTAFYKGLFGWSMENTMPMGEKGDYRFIDQDCGQIGAINPWMADYMTVGWLPYFGVADIEAARDAAKAAGGTVTHDVHEVPNGDFIFTATDPAGAAVGFVGPKGA
jgi:predicted enzyme related to lactoylglutathione lyase